LPLSRLQIQAEFCEFWERDLRARGNMVATEEIADLQSI
jgi:hypothetical protein